jgi:hypothetical protein
MPVVAHAVDVAAMIMRPRRIMYFSMSISETEWV